MLDIKWQNNNELRVVIIDGEPRLCVCEGNWCREATKDEKRRYSRFISSLMASSYF